jgi:hypothetical protein
MAAYGRWTTTDPILGEQGAAALLEQDRRLLTMSAYNYAFNDPVKLRDPTGRIPCGGICTAAIAATGGAVVGAIGGATTSLIVQATTEGSVDFSKVGTEALKGAGVGVGAVVSPILGAAVAGGLVELGEGIAKNESLEKIGVESGLGIFGGAAGGAVVKGLGRTVGQKQLQTLLNGLRKEIGNTSFLKGLLTPSGAKVGARAYGTPVVISTAGSLGEDGTENISKAALKSLEKLNKVIQRQVLQAQEQLELPENLRR